MNQYDTDIYDEVFAITWFGAYLHCKLPNTGLIGPPVEYSGARYLIVFFYTSQHVIVCKQGQIYMSHIYNDDYTSTLTRNL